MGLHLRIEYSFLIAGHTKFSCDQCFGTLKSKTRKTPLWTLYDIANATEQSSTINYAEIVGTHDMEVFVPTYDWASYLDRYFKKLKGIKSYHHFQVDINEPGALTCKENVNSKPVTVNLLRNLESLPPVGKLPEIIVPKGLSVERKKYLFDEIRAFCKEGTEDVVAPCPSF